MVKREGNLVSYCAITVDDCFFAASRDDEWVNFIVNMLKGAFDELNLERGEVIDILGMTFHMKRDKRRAVINQKRFVTKLAEEFKITKTSVTPATGDLLYGKGVSFWEIRGSYVCLQAHLPGDIFPRSVFGLEI